MDAFSAAFSFVAPDEIAETTPNQEDGTIYPQMLAHEYAPEGLATETWGARSLRP